MRRGQKSLNGFKFGILMFSFSEWRRGKHGSEKVKNHPKNLAKEECSPDRGLRTRKYGTECFQASKRIRVRLSPQTSFPMSWAPLCPITGGGDSSVVRVPDS